MDFIELQGILLDEKPSIELRRRKEELAKLIPEFVETFDFDQKTVWHKNDVFLHTLNVVDGVKPDGRLRLAALFHDIGKPDAMTIDEEGQGHFYGHWLLSEDIFRKYQDKFFLDEEAIYLIRKLIYYHDLSIRDDNLHFFLEEFDDEGLKLLFNLKESDSKDHSEEFVPERLRKLEEAKVKLANEKKRIRIDSSEEKVEEDKILLLALLCNSSDSFVFKTMGSNYEEFLVGLSTMNGIVTYPVPIDYWDYFDITVVSNIADLKVSSREEQITKLKSLFRKQD